MKNFSRGFTLIELLVVISIISLLSSVVLASLTEARHKAKGTVFKEHVGEFIKAIELYKINHNGELPFPSMISNYFYETQEDGIDTYGSYDDVDNNLSNENLISSPPIPPFDGRFLFLRYSGYECGKQAVSGKITEEYMIWISGPENTKYFSDWKDLYDDAALIPDYKCFSLK